MEKKTVSCGSLIYRLALAVVISGAAMLAVSMFSPLIGAVFYLIKITATAFAVSFGLLAAMMWLTFSALGYDAGAEGKIGFGKFAVRFIPAAIFLLLYALIRNFMVFLPSSLSSMMLLAYVLAGYSFKAVPQAVSVPGLGLYFLISVAIHIIAATVLSYIFYNVGIKRREAFRASLADGTADDEKPKKSLAARLWFIPFANLVPFFPWLLKYYAYPEYKLRYFIPRFLLIIATYFGLTASRSLIYTITPIQWINIACVFFIYYLVGMITSLIILLDEKRNAKRRGEKY